MSGGPSFRETIILVFQIPMELNVLTLMVGLYVNASSRFCSSLLVRPGLPPTLAAAAFLVFWSKLLSCYSNLQRSFPTLHYSKSLVRRHPSQRSRQESVDKQLPRCIVRLKSTRAQIRRLSLGKILLGR